MTFSLFIPPQAKEHRVPLLTFLSGLTCTDENFTTKSGCQQFAAQTGIAILAPDTSPRGAHVAKAPDNAWDLGLGAGFYLNATQTPWQKNYQMQAYIIEELQHDIKTLGFDIDLSRQGIMGHSMGGHGALTLAIKYPHLYHSVSAFAPICAPSQCPWGEKAFHHYLGPDRTLWQEFDACQLLASRSWQRSILVDQGTEDPFLQHQLKAQHLEAVCQSNNIELICNYRKGYDHSYFFIASFIKNHIEYHHQQLEKL